MVGAFSVPSVVQKTALTAIVDQAHNSNERPLLRGPTAKPPFGSRLTLSDRFAISRPAAFSSAGHLPMWPFRRKRKMTEAEFLRMVICLVTYDQQDINLQPPPPRKLQPPPPREPLRGVDRAVGELIKLDRMMRKWRRRQKIA
jgi:hypothetical protein